MAVIEYIKDLDVLFQSLRQGEVVLFPSGEEGNTFLDYLHHNGRLGSVRCVATEHDSTANTFVHNLPIIPIREMPQFRSSATVIVSAAESKADKLIIMLLKLGFVMIMCLTVELQNKMRDDMQSSAMPDDIETQTMDRLVGKFDSTAYEMSMRNEICELNTAAFEKYRGCFRGRKVVVCGCGPTMSYYNTMPDAVHISLNGAYVNEKIAFEFLFAHDPGGTNGKPAFIAAFKKISERVFLGKPLNGGGFRENYSVLGEHVSRYFKGDNNVGQTIHRNICCAPLTDFWSIYSSAFEFAFFTCPSEIYLVGCDVSMAGHFYDTADAAERYWLNTSVCKVGYSRLKLFGRQYYPDTKIISINPVGLKGLFEDVYTDEYKAVLAAQENKSE